MRFFLAPTFLLTLVGMASILAFQSLNKQELLDKARFENAIRTANLGPLTLYASPLVGHFLLCVFWRNRYPFFGFMVSVILAAVTAWGHLVDWLLWKDRPAPQDQITYLAGFYAACAAWAIVFAFWVIGLLRRGRPDQPGDKS